MAKFKRTITVDVSKVELESIIKRFFNLPESARVSFNLAEQSDCMDRYSSYVFKNASVTYEEEVNQFSEHDGRGPG